MTARSESPLPASLTRTEPRATYAIARLHRAMRHELDEAVRPFGVSTPQYATLVELHRQASQTNAQLARRTFMTPQSMSEVIKVLETKGLVTRAADETHARLIRISLTDDGLRVLGECEQAVDVVEEQMLRELTQHDREQFLAHLKSGIRMLGAGFPQH